MIVAATGHRPDKLGGYAIGPATRRLILARRWLKLIDAPDNNKVSYPQQGAPYP